jgi:copper resistance protein C
VILRTLLTMALLLAAPNAWPHAFLARAAPPVGSQSATSPPQLTLRFTEPVEPLFCTVELQDQAGAAVTLPAPRPEDGAQALVVTLPKLPPGTYTVIWHVTSIDTHKTEGHYQFTVGP